MSNAQRETSMSLARKLFAERLTAEPGAGEWVVRDELVVGPGPLAAHLENRHGGDGHLDIGISLNRDADSPLLWTCFAGSGADQEAAYKHAIEGWVATTLPVIYEIFNQRGERAQHFMGTEPGACPGWHVIHGPWTGEATSGAGADRISMWTDERSVLAAIGPTLTRSFTRSELNCVKVLIGSIDPPVAEVMLNGERHEASSRILMEMDWPRNEGALMRCTMVFMHEHPDGVCGSPIAAESLPIAEGESKSTNGPTNSPTHVIASVAVILAVAFGVFLWWKKFHG